MQGLGHTQQILGVAAGLGQGVRPAGRWRTHPRSPASGSVPPARCRARGCGGSPRRSRRAYGRRRGPQPGPRRTAPRSAPRPRRRRSRHPPPRRHRRRPPARRSLAAHPAPSRARTTPPGWTTRLGTPVPSRARPAPCARWWPPRPPATRHRPPSRPRPTRRRLAARSPPSPPPREAHRPRPGGLATPRAPPLSSDPGATKRDPHPTRKAPGPTTNHKSPSARSLIEIIVEMASKCNQLAGQNNERVQIKGRCPGETRVGSH